MMELKEEINNLIKVSLFASISLCYCYYVGKFIPKGLPRLITILPVVLFFLSIPLFLNSAHLIGAVSLYISWLANFKLLLFAFESGPLSTPSIPLSSFLALACFPIKISPQKLDSPSSKDFAKVNHTPIIKKNTSQKSFFNYGIKCLLLALFIRVYYDFRGILNPMIAWIFLGFSVYFCLELILALISIIVGFFLGVELDPQFDEPYLSTSLQDFWGRRWNLMVNRILHPTVYNPIHKLSTRVVGREWAPIPAILSTFAVSGLMHELIFFYFTRAWPTWDVMLFFCLHGVCLVTEIVIKKAINVNWSLPRQITAPLIVVFVLATSYWLFFPGLLRCNMIERAFEDYVAVATLAKDVVRAPHIHVIGP